MKGFIMDNKKLQDALKSVMPQTRREFLTASSMSILGIAASSVIPGPVRAAISVVSGEGRAYSIEDLDSINFHVLKSSTPTLSLNEVTFKQPTDEALYISHVMFQEINKVQFKNKYSSLSAGFGSYLQPNMSVYDANDGIDSVRDIHSDYFLYFSEHNTEYISELLMSGYKDETNVSVANRLSFNTWDMIKANADISSAENGEDYQRIMDRLYSIATYYCQANRMGQYKGSGKTWLENLMKHYQQNDILNDLIIQADIDGNNTSSFTSAMQKINGTTHKVRALNAAANFSTPEEDIREFERMMHGALYNGFAMSQLWGDKNDTDSVLGNRSNFISVAQFLQTETGAQVAFWQRFFSDNSINSVWLKLNTLNIGNLKLKDQQAYIRIANAYPDYFQPKNRGATDAYLSTLIFILGTSHFSWAVATDRTEADIASIIGLAAAFSQATIDVAYHIAVLQTSKYIFGSAKPLTNAIVDTMAKYSTFLAKVTKKGAVIFNPEYKVVQSLFGKIGINSVINKCMTALAVVGTALAAFNLVKAIQSGDKVEIIFASIDMLLAAGSLYLVTVGGMAAGPVGIVFAVFAIIVVIAKWLYSLFRKPAPTQTLIQRYTSDVIKPEGLEHADTGSMLCKVSTAYGSKICALDSKTINTDWLNMTNLGIQPSEYSERNALVTSKVTGRVYNFSSLNGGLPYCKKESFFVNGTNLKISGSRDGQKIGIAAVESVNLVGKSQALIYAKRNQMDYGSLYWTKDINSVRAIEIDFNSSNLVDLPPNETGRRDECYDIMAINDQKDCIFIILAKFGIYQFKNGEMTVISKDYDLVTNQSELSSNPFSASPTGLTTGDVVNIFYSITERAPYSNETLRTIHFHYVLKKDMYGDYNYLSLINTITNEGKNQYIVIGYAGFHYKKDDGRGLNPRIDFIRIRPDGTSIRYERHGSIISPGDDGNGVSGLHNGVEFIVPNNGVNYLYKNALM